MYTAVISLMPKPSWTSFFANLLSVKERTLKSFTTQNKPKIPVKKPSIDSLSDTSSKIKGLMKIAKLIEKIATLIKIAFFSS